MKSNSLRIRATTRFCRDFDRAQTLLRVAAVGALSDLTRAFHARPDLALRRYNTVKGMGQKVLEIDVTGAQRMFAHWKDGDLYLLALGNHELTKHYQQTGQVTDEIARCGPLPNALTKLSSLPFFTFEVEHEWRDFASEADQSWFAYLDHEQSESVQNILSRVARSDYKRDWHLALVVGGPGTGKTSVLLALFERTFELDLIPQIVVEDQVADFLREAAGIDVEPFRVDIWDAEEVSEGGILLVDDPGSFAVVKKARWYAQKRIFRSVVVGFDPLQLAGKFDDAKYEALSDGDGAHVSSLTSCYRQKRALGEATKRTIDVIAASNPNLAYEKQEAFRASRVQINGVANNFSFPNSGGRFKVHLSPTPEVLRMEVDRLLRARGLWRHWSPYLIAIDNDVQTLPTSWRQQFDRLPNRTEIQLGASSTIKGVEFQHALVVLSESLFLKLQDGFDGTGQRVYEERQLLRIPLSRAKDSVTLFVHSTES